MIVQELDKRDSFFCLRIFRSSVGGREIHTLLRTRVGVKRCEEEYVWLDGMDDASQRGRSGGERKGQFRCSMTWVAEQWMNVDDMRVFGGFSEGGLGSTEPPR